MKKALLVICSALALQGCLLERVAELSHSTPERDYWRNPAMSEDLRSDDWLECGGSENGMWSINLPDGTPDKVNRAAHDQKIIEIMACMRAKGYSRDKGDDGWLPNGWECQNSCE